MGQILDRRRVMGKKDNGYIQDGLIFWLDGINKGDDPLCWTDLKQGVTFDYVNGVTPLSNRVNFAQGHAVCYADDSYLSFFNTLNAIDCTFEICLNNSANLTSYISFYVGIVSRLTFGFLYNNLLYGTNMSDRDYQAINNKGHLSFSINTSDAKSYENGALMTKVPGTFWSVYEGNKISIGSRGSNANYIFYGDIFSIRIYNRLLSEAEAMNNYNVDKKRFNLNT